MKKIWFNHWFSQAYHFINSLRADSDNYILGTNERSTCVYKNIVHEFYLEPVFDNQDEYVDWCLAFCKQHQVDVFFPRRGMDTIVLRAQEFEAIDVKLILDTNIELHNLLQSKMKSCLYMNKHQLCPAPLMFTVNTQFEFYSAFQLLKNRYGEDMRLCFKKDMDEGGLSFGCLCDDAVSALYKSDVYYKDFPKLMESDKEVNHNPYIIMPFLEEPEVSIDCLRVGDELIAIPRFKESNRITKIEFDEGLIKIAEKINENLKIEYPYNIQLRKLNGQYVFMEINTRMAGGSFKANAVGCDFASLALKIAYGEHIDVHAIKSDFHNKYLSNLETFVEISND